jgi:hypothetical protein
MVRRSVRLAAVALAALAAFPFDSFADSRLPEDARRNAWAALSERAAWGEEKRPSMRQPSPEGVELGWLKRSDLKPGSGLQLDLAPGFAVCADWDRYRPKGVPVRDAIDTLLVGFQFSFH